MKPTKRERDRKTNEAALSLRRGRREVAIHEAGHAVGFVMAGVGIEYCDIKKGPSRSGFTQPLKRFVHVDGKIFEKAAVAYLAGGRAEISLTHDLNTVHISTRADRALLLKLAEEVGLTEADREKFMGAATLLASEFVKDNRDCIDSVADELILNVRLDGKRIKEIVRVTISARKVIVRRFALNVTRDGVELMAAGVATYSPNVSEPKARSKPRPSLRGTPVGKPRQSVTHVLWPSSSPVVEEVFAVVK